MIVVVMGVAGSGKTTIGSMLAEAMHCGFLEGDSLHPAGNVAKMTQGIPLTDAERAPWLAAIHERLFEAFSRCESLVVACSALTHSSRTILAEGVAINWVYLKGTPALIRSRLRHRTGHFMKADMLESQLETLQEPTDAITADISQAPAAIVTKILRELRDATPGGTIRSRDA